MQDLPARHTAKAKAHSMAGKLAEPESPLARAHLAAAAAHLLAGRCHRWGDELASSYSAAANRATRAALALE